MSVVRYDDMDYNNQRGQQSEMATNVVSMAIMAMGDEHRLREPTSGAYRLFGDADGAITEILEGEPVFSVGITDSRNYTADASNYSKRSLQAGQKLLGVSVLNGIQFPIAGGMPGAMAGLQESWLNNGTMRFIGRSRGVVPGSTLTNGNKLRGSYTRTMNHVTVQIGGQATLFNNGPERLSQGDLVGYDFRKLIDYVQSGHIPASHKRVQPPLVRIKMTTDLMAVRLSTSTVALEELLHQVMRHHTGATDGFAVHQAAIREATEAVRRVRREITDSLVTPIGIVLKAAAVNQKVTLELRTN